MTVEIQSVTANGMLPPGFLVVIWRDSVNGDWLSSVIEQPGEVYPDPALPIVLIDSIVDASGVKIPGRMAVNFTVNGVAHSQNIDQIVTLPDPPPVKKFPRPFRIIDDLEASLRPNWTRPGIRNKTACTVRMKGGTGSTNLPPAWMDFARAINPAPLARNYQFNDAGNFNKDVGWHNGGNGNKVEQVVFAGNIIEVLGIEGDRAYVKTFSTDQTPPAVKLPVPPEHDLLIHAFTVQYPTYLDFDVAGNRGPRFPRVFPMANPGERLYISTLDIAEL